MSGGVKGGSERYSWDEQGESRSVRAGKENEILVARMRKRGRPTRGPSDGKKPARTTVHYY